MNFIQAIKTCFRNYSKCTGEAARASRSEFWYWKLFYFLSSFIVLGLDTIIFQTPFMDTQALHPFGIIFGLIIVLPNINVTIRRLHDLNRSGWWLLFIGLIGVLLILLFKHLLPGIHSKLIDYFIAEIPAYIWFCKKGTDGPNDFGYDPL